MKKMMMAFAGLLMVCMSLQAQEKKSGAIQFESVVDPAVMAEANGMTLTPEMAARMQKSKTSFELLFNATNASYMKVEEVEDSNSEGPGGGRSFRFGGAGGGNRDYYYEIPTRKLTAAFDMNDTTYFMNVELGKVASPMMGNRGMIGTPVVEYIKSDETKKILGYTCQKVTVKTTSKRKIQDEEKEIVDESVIWYTKDLGFDFSPNPALWTEGAVLAIEGKGNSTIATSIEMRKVNGKDVLLPKKGTVITAEALNAKMESMMKNMRQRQGNRPGNGVRNIIVN